MATERRPSLASTLIVGGLALWILANIIAGWFTSGGAIK